MNPEQTDKPSESEPEHVGQVYCVTQQEDDVKNCKNKHFVSCLKVLTGSKTKDFQTRTHPEQNLRFWLKKQKQQILIKQKTSRDSCNLTWIKT